MNKYALLNTFFILNSLFVTVTLQAALRTGFTNIFMETYNHLMHLDGKRGSYVSTKKFDA